MFLFYVSRDGWNTSHGYCDWWRNKPMEMDHAVWPSVGMEIGYDLVVTEARLGNVHKPVIYNKLVK